MSNVTTMAQRELGAYVFSPIAYVATALFLGTTGLAFGLGVFEPGGEASLRKLLDPWVILILVLVVPLLAMRLMSEEYRSGTIETLLTVPITEAEVIIGKFLGAFAFCLAMLATMLVYPIILSMYGDLDVWLLLCNYLGMALFCGLGLSIGLFFSTCTRHQLLAGMFTLGLLVLGTFAFFELSQLTQGWVRVVLQQLSIRTHYHDFVRGMVDLNHVMFFVSTTGLFLFFSVKRLEMRRWQ